MDDGADIQTALETARAEGYRAGIEVGRSIGWVDGFYSGVDVGRRKQHNMKIWYAASVLIMAIVIVGVMYG